MDQEFEPSSHPADAGRLPSGRFAPGHSGNPKGRPLGSRNRSTILAALLAEGESERLARAEIDEALKGHAVARRFVLSRVMGRGRPIVLDLPDDADPETGLLAVQRGLAAGEILPDEALKLARFFAARRRDEREKPADADHRNWFVQTLENVTAECEPGERLYQAEYRQRRDDGEADDMAHHHAKIAQQRYELARAEKVLRGEIGMFDRWDWTPADGPLPEPDPDWRPAFPARAAAPDHPDLVRDLQTACNLQAVAVSPLGPEAPRPRPPRRGG